MGRAMRLSPESQRTLELAALLHDVGKILIGEQILGKLGKLTDQEAYMIRQHREMGEKIVGNVKFLREITLFIRRHHERFDGPSGESIPLEARGSSSSPKSSIPSRPKPHTIQLWTPKKPVRRWRGGTEPGSTPRSLVSF